MLPATWDSIWKTRFYHNSRFHHRAPASGWLKKGSHSLCPKYQQYQFNTANVIAPQRQTCSETDEFTEVKQKRKEKKVAVPKHNFCSDTFQSKKHILLRTTAPNKDREGCGWIYCRPQAACLPCDKWHFVVGPWSHSLPWILLRYCFTVVVHTVWGVCFYFNKKRCDSC